MTVVLTRSTASVNKELNMAKQSAIAEVKVKIAAARETHITVLPGQDAIYQAKENEAVAYLAENPPPSDLTNYPFLAAEVGVTAVNANALAQLWLGMATQWRGVAAQLEQLRLSAVGSINAATSQSEIDTAMATFNAGLGL